MSGKQAEAFRNFFTKREPIKKKEEQLNNVEKKENENSNTILGKKRPLEKKEEKLIENKVDVGGELIEVEEEDDDDEEEESEEDIKRKRPRINCKVIDDSDSEEEGEKKTESVQMEIEEKKTETSPKKVEKVSPMKSDTTSIKKVESTPKKIESTPKKNEKEEKKKEEKKNAFSSMLGKSSSSSKPSMSLSGKQKADVDEEEEDLDEDDIKHSKAISLKSGYNPLTAATWLQGKPVPYQALTNAFELIEAESGRLKIQEYLSNLFRTVICTTPEDLLPIAYLASNKLTPAYEGIELGIGETIIIKAILEATGRTRKALDEDYKNMGDLGLVAQASRANQRTLMQPAPLTVRNVFKEYMNIAKSEGNKSQGKKVDIVKKLLVSCKGNEAKYIVRGLQGKLRIGLAEQSILTALAHAIALTPPSATLPPPVLDIREKKGMSSEKISTILTDAVEKVKQAFSELPSYDLVIGALLKGGFEGLDTECHLQPGIPVKPMLAKPTNGVTAVLDRFANLEFTCEFKYDGERAQIHLLPDGSYRIYSRNSENNTPKYPDLIAFLPSTYDKATVNSFVMDAEVVAWDIEKKKLMPFQTLSTRARKDVKEEDVKVKVILQPFDLLYLNGESFLKKSLFFRREKLYSHFKEQEGKFIFAKHTEGSDIESIESFLHESIKEGCEGLMVKTLHVDATYEPSKRSLNWLKLKKDYLENGGDSLDLVPIGAWWGKGKRTGVYGAYLLAAYDIDEEEYQTVCKAGTGFSDVILKQHTDFYKDHIIDKPPFNYNYNATSMTPDVWFEPCQVWEILAADLSISPAHTAANGKVDEVKGIALRFPRFIRIRDDKNPEDATSSTQVAEMYQNQATVQK